MAELHDALKSLSPIDWSDVPVDDPAPYLNSLFAAGELIVNTVPAPAQGTPFHSSKPKYNEPNPALGWKEMHPSEARQHPMHKGHEDLQKNWGKPQKFNAKDNPLNVAIYKMAGNDRHGAWFARRSVHEGLGFNKWKKAMRKEFETSRLVEGGPGAGCIRGIGADARLVSQEVEGAGRMEVWQLSAQFPGPVTPREFITFLATTEGGLSEKSAAEVEGGKKHVPRHLMVLSRPISHPDAPARDGYVRGQYESVEIIREIPLHAAGASQDPELNPVEWIMITRSDPGGGIPRFMVDRGTPGAMIQDLHKFLDWATTVDEDADPSEMKAAGSATDGTSADVAKTPTQTNGHVKQDSKVETSQMPTREREALPQQQPQAEEGMVSNLTQTLGAGVDAYAPTMVSSYMHDKLDTQNQAEDLTSDDESDTSSAESFMSADEMRHATAAPEHQPPTTGPAASSENVSLSSLPSQTQAEELSHKKHLSHHEKEMLKVIKQREKLDKKLDKKREDEEGKLKKAQEAESTESTKAQEKYERELRKTEEKHRKEVEKLERKKAKEAAKIEEKRKKKDDREMISSLSRERDDFRSQVELLRRENGLLHEQIGELQRENTAVTARLGKVGGNDALLSVKDEVEKGSLRSGRSRGSEESGRA